MSRLWCSQADGECYLLSSSEVTSLPDSVTSSSLSCDVTLSGADCEAVYCVVAKGGNVFTAAKDRVVRRYEM